MYSQPIGIGQSVEQWRVRLGEVLNRSTGKCFEGWQAPKKKVDASCARVPKQCARIDGWRLEAKVSIRFPHIDKRSVTLMFTD